VSEQQYKKYLASSKTQAIQTDDVRIVDPNTEQVISNDHLSELQDKTRTPENDPFF
jgi:hypothetical protein